MHVAQIAKPSVAGDHHRAALLPVHRNDQIHDLLQPRDEALNIAARGDIDHGIRRGREEVAGADHVRLAEENDAVAIRMRVGDVDDLNAFAVEEDVLLIADVTCLSATPPRDRGDFVPLGALIRFSTF